MSDDIGLDCVCYDFCRGAALLLYTAEYVAYGQKMTLHDNISLHPKRCHHPLITKLTDAHFFPEKFPYSIDYLYFLDLIHLSS